jgi:hypothetical protein
MEIQAQASPAERFELLGTPHAVALHLGEVVKVRGALHLVSSLALAATEYTASAGGTIEGTAERLNDIDAAVKIAREALLSLFAIQLPTRGNA